tara:strand:- start:43 stop:456 length:414 start_codon:yes stop_codon:yes gene_type:complete
MARVTVEDCIEKVNSRFELVLIAAHRARLLHNGENSTVDKDNDKPPVIALREIADETIAVNDLRESLIKSNQKFLETEVEEEVLKTTDDNTENVDLSKDSAESDIKSEEISEETNTDINLKEDKTDKIEENSVSDNI